MAWRDLIGWLFWLALIVFSLGLLRRWRLWHQGSPILARWRDLAHIPKRYFVDLHNVVSRDPYVAHAHIAVGGGAVATLVLVAFNEGLFLQAPVLDGLTIVCAAVMLGGALAMAWRRRAPPAHLSRGGWQRLPWTLALGALGLVAALASQNVSGTGATLIGTLTLVAISICAIELAFGVGWGLPMKHAVAGLLYLAWHPRPLRFKTQPVGPGTQRDFTALERLNSPPANALPSKTIDLPWTRLLSFDACVQCGRCEAVCPAFAAGQPLNPKKLIQDMVSDFAGKAEPAYQGSAHPENLQPSHEGIADAPLIDPATLWSCTTCRACVQACPMMIEHVDLMVDFRRRQTLVAGVVPNQGAAVLESLRDTDTQGRHRLNARYHWASDLDLPIIGPGQSCEWLLLAGESAFELRGQRSLRALVQTLQTASINPGILGAAETDCGDVARRLGDEIGFERLAQQLIDTLNTRQIKHIVTADPHLLHCLRNEFPAFGVSLDIWHHTELLADLLDRGALKAKQSGNQNTPTVTLHDPCYLARYNGQTEAPRAALAAVGIKLVEMARHGENARCCGGGGGAPLTDIAGTTRIPDLRMADARESAATIVAVACPQCAVMLEGVIGEQPEVLDIAELIAQAVV